MLSPIESSDFEELRQLITSTIRHSVAESEEDALFLIDDLVKSLDRWGESQTDSYHLKHQESGITTGFIIVKEYWNLSHLFVLPTHQSKGVGRLLVEQALQACRGKSPREKIQLNSSGFAAGFYRLLGFTQTGPGVDRPGGCIPFEHSF